MDLVEDDVVAAAVRYSAVRKHRTCTCGAKKCLNAHDAWKEAASLPALLVPSLTKEELRDGKWRAHEEAAAAGVFRLLRVAVWLHSAQMCT